MAPSAQRWLLVAPLSGLISLACAVIHAIGPCGTLAESPPASCYEKQGPIVIMPVWDWVKFVRDSSANISTLTLSLGDSLPLRIAGLLYVYPGKWRSSDEGVATIKRLESPSEDAELVTRRIGATTIHVRVSGKSDSLRVVVIPRAPPR